jgi:hypothetical protein
LLPAWRWKTITSLLKAGNVRLPFGKYKGRRLRDVSRRHLDWLAAQDGLLPWLAGAVRDEVLTRQREHDASHAVLDELMACSRRQAVCSSAFLAGKTWHLLASEAMADLLPGGVVLRLDRVHNGEVRGGLLFWAREALTASMAPLIVVSEDDPRQSGNVESAWHCLRLFRPPGRCLSKPARRAMLRLLQGAFAAVQSEREHPLPVPRVWSVKANGPCTVSELMETCAARLDLVAESDEAAPAGEGVRHA